MNALRVGDTRRAVQRTAVALAGAASPVLGLPGIPATAQFPNTLPTLQISGYQQLGSPAGPVVGKEERAVSADRPSDDPAELGREGGLRSSAI